MNKQEFIKNVRGAIKGYSPYLLLESDLESVIQQAIAEHEAFNFNKIIDIRNYLLRHPDQDMIKAACLHYLGDSYNDQKQWKPYPDNLPEIGPTYLIQRKGNNIQITSSAYTYWSRLDIIAFRELPEPYQEGLQSFGSLNGCHNCKHQDNDDVCKKCDDTWDKWEGGER